MRRIIIVALPLIFCIAVASVLWQLLSPSVSPRHKEVLTDGVRIVYITHPDRVNENWLSERFLQPLWFGPSRETIPETIEALREKVAQNPNDPKIVSDLAILLSQKRRWEEALTYARRWTELATTVDDRLNSWILVAYALVNLNRYHGAIEELDKSMRYNTHPKSKGYLYSVRGEVLLVMAGQDEQRRDEYLEQAGESFNKALTSAPDLRRALLGKARWHLLRHTWGVSQTNDELEQADQLLKRLYTVGVEYEREQVLTAYYQGVVYERKGNLGLAK